MVVTVKLLVPVVFKIIKKQFVMAAANIDDSIMRNAYASVSQKYLALHKNDNKEQLIPSTSILMSLGSAR